jgi:hypothetical protein
VHQAERAGRPFLSREVLGGGSGGRTYADGNDAIQGGGSTNNGTYTSTHLGVFDGVPDDGAWQFTFQQHFGSVTMSWTDVTVTLHKSGLPFVTDVSPRGHGPTAAADGDSGRCGTSRTRPARCRSSSSGAASIWPWAAPTST